MDLREFISETITQVVEGIAIAQKEVGPKGAVVMPSKIWTPDAQSLPVAFLAPRSTDIVGRHVTFLRYDVGVQTIDEGGSGAKLKVAAGFFTIGKAEGDVEGSSSHAKTAVHRIQFDIPVALPTQAEQTGKG
jgi:hypothetical protein